VPGGPVRGQGTWQRFSPALAQAIDAGTQRHRNLPHLAADRTTRVHRLFTTRDGQSPTLALSTYQPASPMRIAGGYLQLLGDWLDKKLSLCQ